MDPEVGMSDEDMYDRAKVESSQSFPIAVTDRLLAGENVVRMYHDHRGMIQKHLAEAAGTNAVYQSHIETEKRTGSAHTFVGVYLSSSLMAM